jgi:hypothetical protein
MRLMIVMSGKSGKINEKLRNKDCFLDKKQFNRKLYVNNRPSERKVTN